jgi:glycolate oxidase iron-sulfur subunit
VQHQLPLAELGRHGDAMARAVSSCVHCGFCLPACPTYKVLGEEMDSPRGRILLMKHALEGTITAADAAPYIERCLGCLACETACPSGVRYRDLLVPYRGVQAERTMPPVVRRLRSLVLSTLERPTVFRRLATLGRAAAPLAAMLPPTLRTALALLPRRLPPPEPLPALCRATAPRRARVGLVAGCVQQALRPSINAAACRLLAANGVEVVIPPAQRCCGALARHAGLEARADRLAEHNRAIFPRDLDAIIATAAGCGSALKDAQPQSPPVFDVLEFLDRLGLRTSLALDPPTTIAYQDACHLVHGQGVRDAPRRLLRQVNGVTLVDSLEADLCCGSAGLYNLEHPDTAAVLGRRKARALAATGAGLVATGNIGCLTQLERFLRLEPQPIPVQHTIEVLDSAYSAEARESSSVIRSRP